MKELFNTLKKELQVSEKKIVFFINFIEAIIQARTVNLDRISEYMGNNIKKSSNYRKLQRFFKDYKIIFTYFAKLLMNFIPEEKRVLIIDRTQWKGINIFFLCVEYQGIAIPILWDVLDKKGSTNTLERINLIKDYVNVFGKETIKYLVADREFVGKLWFDWLNTEDIKFLIRIKQNFLVTSDINKKTKVKGFFRFYTSKTKIFELFGTQLHIMGKRINSKTLLIVATNSNELILEDYSKRWAIENMFSCFKKKGFDLEATKMNEKYKIEKLIALISLAYCCCIKLGFIFKKKDSFYRNDLKYYNKSIFKIGLDRLSISISKSSFNNYNYSQFHNLKLPKHLIYSVSVVV